ncbi:acyl-CoA/acyl-ACP dehydrogenase [Acetobacteraceae bacterium KSS8]|uniref:Acyl-CoA/acyl-ACP dehydrogenase n=1 Tax=Endosaccharibacter trunci TaxID=2812733 RepID=A0ABT1W5U4_9PROT|nr:acyl-CoA/acyl-ACP dehydrogenase [Acetobacteraceae bacterium KSS8]
MDGSITPQFSRDAEIDAVAALWARTAAQHDRDATLPREALALAHRHGLLSLAIPAEQGGSGTDLATLADIVGRLAQGDPAATLILVMHTLIHAGIARDARWPARLRDAVVRATLEEGALLNALRVEPDLGTPARGGLPDTVARKDGGQWRITGRKIYSTGGALLRWGLVWVRTDDPAPRTGFVLVPLDAEGVSIEASWNHLGMRASGSHTVVFDDVAVPLDHAVDVRSPEEWAAPDPAHALWGNVLVAALYDGVARSARHWLGTFLRERTPSNLGRPLATLPRIQEQVGQIDAILLSNRLVLAGAAGGRVDAAESGLVKTLVCENAIRAVDLALALSGNHGLSRDNPLERHHRDVLCSRVHTPQPDAAFGMAGRVALESGS